MKLQTKIFILFALSTVVILTVINFVTIYFFKEEQQRYEREIISVYEEIRRQNRHYPLPKHIIQFGEEIRIDRAYSEEKFKRYSRTVLLWESLFVIILSYFFYRVLLLIGKKEREHEEFLKFLFFVLSHKIGNFLSIVKTNTAILKLNPNLQSIDRIEKSCDYIDSEIRKSMETIKKLPRLSKVRQIIDMEEIIKKIIKEQEGDKKIIISLRQVTLESDPESIETILFLLFDNAFRYSRSKIHIKLCKDSIAIRNDFSEVLKGSGLGLQIADYLCKIHKFEILRRAKNDHFLVLFKFRQSSL